MTVLSCDVLTLCCAIPCTARAFAGFHTGLWNFNDLLPNTTLLNSDGAAVIKRGATPCALPADAATGAPVCADVWVTGAGGAAVPAFVPGRFGQGLNIASGLLNWGELGTESGRFD